MFPCFHALENMLLLVGGHTGEMVQPLLELLLPLLWKAAKRRIVFQRVPLLVKRLLTVLVQPLP